MKEDKMFGIMSRRLVLAGTLAFALACAPAETPMDEPPMDEPPPAMPPEAPMEQPMAPPDEASVTLTGCLEQANGDFALIVTEATDDVMAGVRFDLDPEPGVGLEGHVGHTVRLTGIEESGMDPGVRTFKVEAMQHVSAECEPPVSTE